MGPAYTKLLETLTRLQQHATREDGVWKLPDGAAYYASAQTHNDYIHDDGKIHQLGLDEVARIPFEMKDIQAQVGFEGSLQDFLNTCEPTQNIFIPTRQKERLATFRKRKRSSERLKQRSQKYFITTPKAPLAVKAVSRIERNRRGKRSTVAEHPTAVVRAPTTPICTI